MPSATSGEHLFEHESASAYFVFVPCQRAEVVDGSEHCGSQDAAGAETTASRYSRKQCDFYTASKALKLLAKRGETLAAEVGQEACKGKCGLGYGERTSHVAEVGQLFEGFDALHGTEVDAAEHYMRLATWSDVGLQRRLSVEFYCKVHHVSSFCETIRRCVGPSTGNVDAHRTACPHYLVGIYRHAWLLLHGGLRSDEPLTEKGESLLFKFRRTRSVAAASRQF